MLLAVGVGFFLALLAPLLTRWLGPRCGWLTALLPLGLFLYFLRQLPLVRGGRSIAQSTPWAATLEVPLAFSLDGLSLFFALLICGIGALVLVYARGYFAGDAALGPFQLLLLVFMASMLGLVLSDNVLLLYVFWELTTISSFLLIGLRHKQHEARAAARQALLVTSGGGLALLAGLLMLASVGGTFQISELLGQAEMLREHPLYVPILVLLALAAFTKSAQFPFHFWLPDAMQAPTPVSAYLHSATMVKAGIYLLARFYPLLSGTLWWQWLITPVGGLTMVLAGWWAFQHRDLKLILAYSTISVLGMVTMLLGLGTHTALVAAMLMLLSHALYKGALFLIAGAVEHETGQRDVLELRGLRRSMPLTAVAAALAALSMAGFLPAVGYVAKETLYEAAQRLTYGTPLVAGAAVWASVLLVAVAALIFFEPFAGSPTPRAKQAHEAPPSMWVGPIVLGLVGLVLGFFPDLVEYPLIAASVHAIAREAVPVKLKLWHGLNLTLLLSLLTLLGGVGVYVWRRRVWQAQRVHEALAPLSPGYLFNRAAHGVDAFARWQTRVLQHGYLRLYVLVTLSALLGLLAAVLVLGPPLMWTPRWSTIRLYEWALAALILAAAVLTIWARSRLGAIAALGGVGFSMAMVFILYGAPDLAMTQFVVETLTVLLLVLILVRLPDEPDRSPWTARLRDGLIALSSGGALTALLLVAMSVRAYEPISGYYIENSYSEAHGRNVVNVILTDFRAIDTLGEITVLAVAGVGVWTLLKLRSTGGEAA